MGAGILTLITTTLPLLIKLIMWIIEKKEDNIKMREDFLKFIASLEGDNAVKMNVKYHEQLERLKKQINEGK